ncbi:hypothetical protein H4582DRAFT_2124722 [Lactarius indigo]|nr:hypothetical protein H4582DRAFT_2124722 [Lactarius indigo]
MTFRCDDKTNHFGSVEDNKPILMWPGPIKVKFPVLTCRDSVGLLGWDTAPSKVIPMPPSPFHGQLSLAFGAPARRHSYLPFPGAEGLLRRCYPAPLRNEVAIVKLVLVKQLENDILIAVTFHCQRRLGRTSRAATHRTLIGLSDLRIEGWLPILSEVELTSHQPKEILHNADINEV